MNDIERLPLDSPDQFVDKEYPEMDLPEINIGWLKRFWAKINGHKSTICYIGMLAGGVLSVIPATSLLGKALFAVSFGSVGASLIHREGKASKYGEEGKFGFKDLWNALKDLLNALLRVYTVIKNLKKEGGK